MSLYVSGDKDKVGKLRRLAEGMGLEPLYNDEKISASILVAAMKANPGMKKRMIYSVFQVERKYRELKRPVSPADIIGNDGDYSDVRMKLRIPSYNSNESARDKLSHYLKLANLRGMVNREEAESGGKKTHVYIPVAKTPG
jgi:hypothetical protein